MPKYIYSDPSRPMQAFEVKYSMPFQLGDGWFFSRFAVHPDPNLDNSEHTSGPYDTYEATIGQIAAAMQRDNAERKSIP